MKPRSTGLCHHNVKAAPTGSVKMEDDSWFRVASLHQHSSAKESAVKQPPAPTSWASTTWRAADPSRDPLSLPSEWGGGDGVNWVPKKLAGWLPWIFHPPRTKGDVAMLCYQLLSPGPKKRIVESSKVQRGGGYVFLAGHIQLASAQSAYCIDFDWRGFNCNLKIWPFQEFLK